MKEEMKKKSLWKRWYFYPILLLAVLTAALGGLMAFLTASEYRPKPVEPALSGGSAAKAYGGEAFRIVTFNMGFAGLGKNADFIMDGGKGMGAEEPEEVAENLEGIGKILQKAQADICMLQEADYSSRRTFYENQLQTLEKVLPEHLWYYGSNYVCAYVPYPLQQPIGKVHSGVASYSRYEAVNGERISLPVPFSWPVRTANLKRCVLSMRIPVKDTGRELVIFNFHLEAYDGGEGKQAQTQQLLDLMKEEYEKGNFVVAGGDFNQIFPEVKTEVKPTSQWVPGNLEPLPEAMAGWQYVYDDSVPTCRLLNQPYDPQSPLTQYYVIDGFIISPNLELRSVQTLDEDFQFSDHNPVVMEAAPKKEKQS